MLKAVEHELKARDLLRDANERQLWDNYFEAGDARQRARLADATDTLQMNIGNVENHDGNTLDWHWSEACVALCIHFASRLRRLNLRNLKDLREGMIYAESSALAKQEGYAGILSLLDEIIANK